MKVENRLFNWNSNKRVYLWL